MQTSKSQPEIVDLGSDSDQFEFAHERLLSIDHVEASFDRGQNQPEPFGLRDILDPPNQLIPMVSLDTPFKICLAEVLEVFPDISHDHVQQLYNVRSVADQQAQDKTPVERISLEIITQILDGGRYPKEKDHVNELKRKRTQAIDSDEEEEIQWRNAKRELNIAIYNGEAYVTYIPEVLSFSCLFALSYMIFPLFSDDLF